MFNIFMHVSKEEEMSRLEEIRKEWQEYLAGRDDICNLPFYCIVSPDDVTYLLSLVDRYREGLTAVMGLNPEGDNYPMWARKYARKALEGESD